MDIKDAVAFLEEQAPNSSLGLPDEVFRYISRTTPLVNVDLLIRDEHGRILLTWRDDEYAGTGWHIPGGIIRSRETWENRIKKVAEIEIGASVQFDPAPIAINQMLHEQKTRGHFIGLLFKCSIPSTFVPNNKDLAETDRGYIKWHDTCPEDLLTCQDLYRPYMQQ